MEKLGQLKEKTITYIPEIKTILDLADFLSFLKEQRLQGQLLLSIHSGGIGGAKFIHLLPKETKT